MSRAMWAFARRASGAAVLLLLVGSQGCGDAGRQAQIYRVQRGYWRAYRAGDEARLTGSGADTTQLLQVREQFVKAVDQVAPTIDAMSPDKPRTASDKQLLRVVAHGEIQAARIAMEAKRPDLVVDRCRALVAHAAGDTAITRQVDIMIAGALRRMGRHEEAIAAMKAMLLQYPPHVPDANGVEDFVLTIPTIIVELRKDLGDDAGVRTELEAGANYYERVLHEPNLDPKLQAAVLLHLVHNQLELGRKADALATLDRAEQVVSSRPDLILSIPEIRYTRVKLTAGDAKDPMVPAATLEGIAFDFPQSAVAPLALFDAAMLMEKAKQYPRAAAAYEAVVTRYPRSGETAATAMYNRARIEEATGDWERAKAMYEAIVANFPFSMAAAQAPIAAVEHYARRKDPEGIKTSLQRGVEVYHQMLRSDSLSEGAARLRWNLFRVYVNLGDTRGAFETVDGLSKANPQSPFAAMALLEGAKFAENKGLRTQAATLLNQFLVAYPNSPRAAGVRNELRRLTK